MSAQRRRASKDISWHERLACVYQVVTPAIRHPTIGHDSVDREKVKSAQFFATFRKHMVDHLENPHNTTNAAHTSPPPQAEMDAVESIAHSAPIVLPIVGGVLMFLLAFIAVFLA